MGSPWLARAGKFAPLVVAAIATRARGLFIDLFPYDESHYAALAHKILAGATPYVGAVDHKPVGIELTYAGSFALLGDHMWALRLFAMIVVAVTGWLLGKTSARIFGDERARVAGMIYVVASTWGMPGDVQSINTELFANGVLALAAFALAMRPAARWSWLAAGALTAVAGIYRYPALLCGGAWAVYALVERAPRRTKLGRLVLLALGFSVIAAAYIGAFALAGAWDDFVFWGWRYNATYLAAPTAGEQLAACVRSVAITCAFWLPLLVWVRPWRAPLATAWLGAALLAIVPGGRFFLHYFLAALPALAIVIAPALRERTRRRTIGLVLAGLVTAASTFIVWGYGWLDPGFTRDHAHYRAVGEYVRDHSTPSDRIFVWGSSHMYYYSHRVMASRFWGCYYVTGIMWGSSRDPSEFVVPRAWTELMDDLETARPLFILDESPAGLDGFEAHPMLSYAPMADLIAAHYKVVAVVDGVVVYRRVDTI
jgi:4-amino-4-deoxy-L-arabinose transferase-like glycosyltransferase